MSVGGNQKKFDLNFNPIYMDFFAGGGGASTGFFIATGRHPDIAINHSGAALAIHKANHPTTLHLKTDVFEANPRSLCLGRKVRYAHLSPDCTHFSKSRGSTPVEKKIRGLAYVSLLWAMTTELEVFTLENVEEFLTWGPLEKRNGKMYPDPKNKGETFKGFVDALTTGINPKHPALKEIREYLKPIMQEHYDESKLIKGLGYKLEWKVLNAADFGAPTSRKRLFIIARRDGESISWPNPTHGAPSNKQVKNGTLKPYRTAAECIDWSIPTNSIFLTQAEAKKINARLKRPLVDSTLKRIAKGVVKFVMRADKPYISPNNKPSVVNTYYGFSASDKRNYDAREPLRTITADGLRHGITEVAIKKCAFLNSSYGYDVDGNRNYVLTEPLRTIVAERAKHGMVEVDLKQCSFIAKNYGGGANGVTSAGSAIDAPLGTVTGTDHNSLVNIDLNCLVTIDHQSSPKGFDDINNPINTVTSKARHLLIAAHAMRMKFDDEGTSLDEPLSTVCASAKHQGLVLTNLINYYGNGVPLSAEKPAPTIRATSMLGLIDVNVESVCKTIANIEAVRAFLQTYAADMKLSEKEMLGIVTIEGVDYQITDISMRMLNARELFNAQGFPSDYIIAPTITRKSGKKYITKTLPETDQVRAVGNSVCPPVMAAIIKANLEEFADMTNHDSKVA